MPIDPSIPLSVNTQGIDVGKLMSMAEFAHQLRSQVQQEKNTNAIRQAMMAPDAFDPNTNTITPNTLKRVMQIDPQTGIKLQGDILESQMKQAQAKHYESENGRMSFDAMTGIAGSTYDAYTEAKKQGASEADARQKATAVRNEAAKNSGGLLSDNDVEKLTNSPFDPDQTQAFANLNKEWSGQRAKTREDTERDRHDMAMEANVARGQNIRIETGENAKWQVLTDPKSNTQYRYNPETGQSTTLDGQTAYAHGGAAKISSGQARSAAALAAQRYVQEHPDATAEDVAQFAADYGKTVKSVGAFSTGKQGDMVRSFNVAISHLNTLDGLVDALDNGDVQLLNKASQGFKQQFGKAAPANFDAAKAIVGDEIIKAIVGGGGALADRENAQNQINRAESPEQLRGVIKTYKELMSGQLKGLGKQYEDTTGRKDFGSRLSPETKKELGMGGQFSPDLPKVNSADDYKKLKKGAAYIHDNKYYVVGTPGAQGDVTP